MVSWLSCSLPLHPSLFAHIRGYEKPPQHTARIPLQDVLDARQPNACEVIRRRKNMTRIILIAVVAGTNGLLGLSLNYLDPLYNTLPPYEYSLAGAMVLDRWLNHLHNAAMHAHLGISPHAFHLVFPQLQELGNHRPTSIYVC